MTIPRSSHSDVANSSYDSLLPLSFLLLNGLASTFHGMLIKQLGTSRYNEMLYIHLGSAATLQIDVSTC